VDLVVDKLNLKARRGDISGPVLAILVTLILLAIGAAIIAYFVLFSAAPQQPVVSILGTPVAFQEKTGSNKAIVNITIANVGGTTLNVSKTSVLLNATGTTVSLTKASGGTISGTKFTLEPGKTATLSFDLGSNSWNKIKDRDFVNAILTIEGVGSQVISIRVLRVTG
jgi:archaellum component FlaF (FlaF/FlaG flagellin family)